MFYTRLAKTIILIRRSLSFGADRSTPITAHYFAAINRTDFKLNPPPVKYIRKACGPAFKDKLLIENDCHFLRPPLLGTAILSAKVELLSRMLIFPLSLSAAINNSRL